jgi:hypothetical protein
MCEPTSKSLARYSESLRWPICFGFCGTGLLSSADTRCRYGLRGSGYFSVPA